jgi:hypothetical protein
MSRRMGMSDTPPNDELDEEPMPEADPPVSDGVTDDDDSDGDDEEVSEEGGEVLWKR